MLKMITDFGKVQEQLEDIIVEQRDQILEKVEYCHPMIIEDLSTRVKDLIVIRADLEEKNDGL